MPQSIVSQFDRKYGLPIETYRSVQNISQRNNIPDSIRWEGMIVHVIGDQSYILLGGTDNTKWEPLGGLVNVNVVDNLLSTSATDALSANQGRVLKDLIDNIDLSDYQLLSEKGAANGYAPLDSGAKVPLANLPDSVLGQVEYQSTWAASTNTPTLSNPPDSSTKGHYYVASDSGTQFGISFQTGDWIISNGNAWEKVDNTDAVTSVFGRIGAVVANTGDYTFAQIGSKPTTLSGYGITDAYTESEVDTLLLGKLGVSDKAADSELLDGIDSTGFVRTSTDQSISGIKTFTGNRLEVSNGTPVIRLQSTAAALDQKNTYLLGTVSGFQIRNYDDSLSGFTTPFSLTRTGTTTTMINFSANLASFSEDVDVVGNVSAVKYKASANPNDWAFLGESNESNLSGLFFQSDNIPTLILRDSSGAIKTRITANGTNSSNIINGNTIWHAGNDGAGSGLDADLLDGVQGSDYARTDIAETFSNSITAASFKTTNWEIVETGGVLQFKYGGVTKFEMNSSGIIEATDFKLGL